MKNISGVLKGINDKKILQKHKQHYVPSGFLRTVHNSEEDFIKTQELFDTADEYLSGVTFNEKIFTSKILLVAAMTMSNSAANFDKTSELMKKVADESDMRESGKKFAENYGIEDFSVIS